VHAVVDSNLNADSRPWRELFSTCQQPAAPGPARTHDVSRTVRVTLEPMEAKVLG
jgi:hypothetical protein